MKVYELIFWVWFVGACGLMAYDVIYSNRTDEQSAILALTWPVVVGGVALAFAYAGIRKVASIHNRWIKA